MVSVFWHDYLFKPVFNTLLFLYDRAAFSNMGVAIIELTIALRLILLPLSIVEERNRYLYEQLSLKVADIEKNFKNDAERRKEKIRELLKSHRVSHWSKVVLLGVQGLMLVLLYQVFMGGLKLTGFEELYSWVVMPEKINTIFLGFNLVARNWQWPLLVSALLFWIIYRDLKKRENLVRRSDVSHLVFFPIFTFIALLMLPMVKSLFVLTSILFSLAVTHVRRTVFKS